MQKVGKQSMKKTIAVIGVLFAVVAGLTVYNNVNETITTKNQPQPAVSNPEPTVSAPADGSVIVRDKGASFVMAPISR